MSLFAPQSGRVAPWIQTHWDARAAGNFIGGGSGTGLLIAAAIAGAAGAPYRPLALVALALVALGLGCVSLEIGRPLRALNVFLHPQTSWMTREAMVSIPLFACGAAALWQDGGPYAWLAAAFAALFLYCQSRILNESKGIPAWREPRVVPVIVATGLAEGTGLAVILLAALGGVASLQWPALALAALLVARTVAWRRYRKRVLAPRRALAVLDGGSPVFDRIANWVGAPLAVVAAVLAPGALSAALAVAAGALAVGGGWGFKFLLVARAGFNQGFALPIPPVRGQGGGGPAAKPGW